MADNGTDRIVQVTVIVNADAGIVSVDHDDDHLTTLTILNAGIRHIVGEMIQARERLKAQLPRPIQTAGVVPLRIEARPGGEDG